MKLKQLLSATGAALLTLALASPVSANIFIDEDFEDGVAWDGSGSTTTGGAVNTFSDNLDGNTVADPSVGTPLTVVPVGSPVVAAGGSPQTPSMAYAVPFGSAFSVTPMGGFTGSAGGPLTYVQFNITGDSTGAVASTVFARLDIPWGTVAAEPVANFYVQLVSDGSGGATVEVGEDGGALTGFGPTTIGTPIAAAGDWKLITVGINKNFTGGGVSDETDPVLGITVPEGTALFWSASPVGSPDAVYPFSAALGESDGLIFTVPSGTDAVLDDFYWEAAMTPGAFPDNSPNRMILDTSLPVELDTFGVE